MQHAPISALLPQPYLPKCHRNALICARNEEWRWCGARATTTIQMTMYGRNKKIEFNRCDRSIYLHGRFDSVHNKAQRKTSTNWRTTEKIFQFSKFRPWTFSPSFLRCRKVFTQRVINWMKLEHVIREQMIRRGLLLLLECVICVCVWVGAAVQQPAVLHHLHHIIIYLQWISWWCGGFQRNTIQQRHTRRD